MAVRDGAAYLAGLRDNREIWIDGERVRDVTAEPRLGRGAQAIAALYDLQTRPDLIDQMTYRSPTSGERVGLSFLEPRSVDDLVRRREMFRRWAEYGCGMIGRSPDYLNALIMGCAANRDYFDRAGREFGDHVVGYYQLCRERDLVMTHTFVPPQRHRGESLHQAEQHDPTTLRIVDENADGLIVSGARILATLAPFSDECLVMPSPSRSYLGETSPYAVALAVPVDAPGLKFICRESFDYGRSHFDHPLASRFDEQDAIAIFKDVLVPWERVFIARDVKLCSEVFRATTAFPHAIHQFMTKNLVKAEFVLGVATLISQTIKIDQHLHVQTMLGEMVDAVETAWAYLRTAEVDAQPDANGIYAPRPETMWTARSYFPRLYPRLIETLQIIGSSGLMAIPSEAMVESELADEIETYFQSATLGGKERIRLFRLAWEVACSSFGQRQVLYERYFAGDFYRNLASRYLNYDKTRAIGLVLDLLQRTGTALRAGR
jgi:4-hydroxyphenylacetate 3-monooxygenase